MNRFRQQFLDERWQQRMDARAQAPQVAEVHAVIPDLSFAAPPCLTLLGQERPSSPFTRLAMISLILSLGLAACSPVEASPTAVSPAPQVTLEPTFTPTFAPTFTPVLPATLESSPNAPAMQEAVLLGTLDALVQSGIAAEQSGEGWILSTTDANAQRVELGEIRKAGDSYQLVFTTTEGNPATESLALATYDTTSFAWVISEPDHHWPVFHLTEQGWEQLLFKVNPDASNFQDPDGNVVSGIHEWLSRPEIGVILMEIFGYGQGLQVKEEDVTIAQHGVIYAFKEQHVIITVVIPIEGSTWGVPVDLVSNISKDASGNVVVGMAFYPNRVIYPVGSPEYLQTPYRPVSHDELRAYFVQGAPVYFELQEVVDLSKLLESFNNGHWEGSVANVNNFLFLKGVKTDDGANARCSSIEACVKLLDEKGLTEEYILSSWGVTPHFLDELRKAIQQQPQIPLSRIRPRSIGGGIVGIGAP